MTELQSTGRRWIWPALSLLSLAGLLLGAWWLAGVRPEPPGTEVPPVASQPRSHLHPPPHSQPHPAALGASEAEQGPPFHRAAVLDPLAPGAQRAQPADTSGMRQVSTAATVQGELTRQARFTRLTP